MDSEGDVKWVFCGSLKNINLFHFSSIAAEATCGCSTSRALLFLTDGVITQGQNPPLLYTSIINNNTNNAVIFTYALGNEANSTDVLKNVLTFF